MILTLYYESCLVFTFSLRFAVFTCLRFSRTVKPSCISTVLLKASQPLHTPPIKLVVFQRTYQATL